MRLLALILAMSVVTYLPRMLPMVVLARWRFPRWLLRLLEGFPVAVLAAFAVPLVLAPENHLNLGLHNLGLPAAVITAIAAMLSRSLIVTAIVGSVSMMLLRFAFG